MKTLSRGAIEATGHCLETRPGVALYAVRIAPRAGKRAPGGSVLICPPLLEEQHWSYRTLQSIAVALARSGVESWRFDLSGTGNSSGQIGVFEDWLSDLDGMISFVAERSVAPIRLLGLRFGAFLVCAGAARSGHACDLALLEPVSDPERHVRQMLHLSTLAGSTTISRDGSVIDHLGYPLPREWRESVADARADIVLPDTVGRVLIVSLQKPRASGREALERWLSGLIPSTVEREECHVPLPPFWNRLGLTVSCLLNDLLVGWVRERAS